MARLTDQLRQEHDAVAAADVTRKKLEVSLRELTIRLEEVDKLGDGRKNIVRLQQRVSGRHTHTYLYLFTCSVIRACIMIGVHGC